MTDPQHIKQIFGDAADLGGAERAAFLDRACADDAAARVEVEALLAAAEGTDALLGRTAAPPPPDGTSDEPQGGGDDAAGRAAERPGSYVGRYKLLQRIGEGGFGVVYMAEQERPIRRRVALKVIKLGMDTRQVVARFEAERQALALMDHPNIARVLDAGATDAGRPYFVMELVKGEPLTAYCDRHDLGTRERLALFVQVCHAVQHAHQKGVIHRDLKPGNVLVTMADGMPIPKVIDFGIAKAVNQRLTEQTLFTEFNQFVGTPQYMSPEQAEMSCLDIDTRADVYSLGAMLYELLTGTTPFDPRELREKGYAEMQRVIREVEPPRPSTRLSTMAGDALSAVAARRRSEPRKLGPLMRGELDWVVMKCLEKDRTRRYETASGLAADVRRFLDGDAVAARPVSAGYRLRKLAWRHKTAFGTAAAVAVALLLGIMGVTVALFRTRAAQQATELARRDADNQKDVALGLLAQVSRAKADVEREARRANASGEFLRRMLASPGAAAEGGGGRAVKVADVLDRASKNLDDLGDQPELVAESRYTLGQTYLVLGLFDEAVREYERSLALARQASGPRSEQALRAAAELVWTKGGQARLVAELAALEPLARETLAAARATLGDLHPVTQQAANAFAAATSQDPAVGETALGPIVERLRLEPPARRPAGAARTFANYADIVRALGRTEEAARLQGEATTQAEREPGLDPVRRLRIRRAAAEALLDTDRLPEAAAAFAEVLAEQRRVLGERHPDVRAALLQHAGVLERLGRLDDAVAARQELVAAMGAAGTDDGSAWGIERGRATFALAELHLWLGHAGDAAEGFEAATREVRQAGVRQPSIRDLWKIYWADAQQKVHLRTDDPWAGTVLRDFAKCAATDVLRGSCAARAETDPVDWEGVRFRLDAWSRSTAKATATGPAATRPAAGVAAPHVEGTVAELRERADPPAGVYLLSLALPRRSGGRPYRCCQWMLASPWELSLYAPPPLATGSGADVPTPEGLPLEVRRADAVAMLTDSQAGRGPGPAGRTRFSVVATTRLALPPGRYRLSVTHDGVARVWVDGHHRGEDAGGAGLLSCELDVAAAPVALRVACLGVTRYAIVTAQPVGDAAHAVVKAACGPFFDIDQWIDGAAEAAARPEASDGDLWNLGHLYARRGDFKSAVAAIGKAIELKPEESWRWYVRGVLLAYDDTGTGEYQRHCAAMWARWGEDGRADVAERVVQVCGLRPDSGVDPARLLAMADRGLPDDPDSPPQPWQKLRRGLAEYRAGNDQRAIDFLAKGSQEVNHRDANVQSHALRAMAEFRLGRFEPAATAYAAARADFAGMNKVGVDDLDGTGLQEWAAAHVLMREARVTLADLVQRRAAERAAALAVKVEEHPNDARPRWDRGMFHAARGEFGQAAADLAAAIELDPAEPMVWLDYLSVLAYLEDDERYRRTAAAALARFGESDDPLPNERIAKGALLRPGPGTDVPRLVRMVDKALAARPAVASRLPWFHLSKALAEYRTGAGHYGAAAEYAAQARSGLGAPVHAAAADLLRAMSLRRDGQAGHAGEEASRLYADVAARVAAEDFPKPGRDEGMERDFAHWCFVQVLLREATPLFSEDAGPP